ncbi:hypothetical protein [Thermomonospora cellulosilytica]|uniref:Uncharacterized protein n=1 Tax=Thermomonospora cellulosilytica TaxID=1411118 RepID=A0A7W3MWJ3_9ACTN|nr:hypothetical protein [Thermomonospora cellulosilytica]MBA9003201.1 hypothetical protein [Thermomonospora cellulosilytica]
MGQQRSTPPGTPYEPWRLETPQRQRRGLKRGLIIGAAVLAVALGVGGAVVLWPGGGEPDKPTTMAGDLFPADPANRADGREQGFNGVAAVGSTVVVVGGEFENFPTTPFRTQFLVSTDAGRTFDQATVRIAGGPASTATGVPRRVAGSQAGWVALGDRPGGGTAVWTSRDGRTWERRPDSAGAAFEIGDRVNYVVAGQSGFLAVGHTSEKGDGSDAEPVAFISSDGTSWRRLDNGDLKMLKGSGTLSLVHAAVFGRGYLVQGARSPRQGVVRQLAWYSENGRSWEETAIPAPDRSAGLAVTGGSGGFVAARQVNADAGPHAEVFTSTDGKEWTATGRIEVPGFQRLVGLTASPGGMTAVIATADAFTLMRSADGASWQQAGTAPKPPSRQYIDYTAVDQHTVLVGSEIGGDLNPVLEIRDAQGRAVSPPPGKLPGVITADRTVRSVAARSGTLVAVGSSGGDASLWTSSKGDDWRRAQGVTTRVGSQRLTGVTVGGAGWLAVGVTAAGGKVTPLAYTSPDGGTWQSVEYDKAFTPRSDDPLIPVTAAAGPKGYVIVGEDGLSAATWFSTDLKTWRRGTGAKKDDLTGDARAPRWLRGVVGGDFGFVGVGGAVEGGADRPAVWSSDDGTMWTRKNLPLPAGARKASFTQIAVKGTTLVATGIATGERGTTPFGYVSADGGKSWRETRLPAGKGPEHGITAMTATSQGFVVAGWTGPYGDGDLMVWRSADGRNWTSENPTGEGLSGPGVQELTGLTESGAGQVLGVGRSARPTSEEPVLWRGRG